MLRHDELNNHQKIAMNPRTRPAFPGRADARPRHRTLNADRFTPQRRPLSRWVSLTVALLCGAPLAAYAGGALPSGGRFIAGRGSISSNGRSVTIGQTTSRGVIDWTQFSIGKGNRVNFENGSGATLNRITGGDPSVILGALSATGSVYLINPQGIVIGRSGAVTTGGRFVASTLDTCSCAFMKGHPSDFHGDSHALVVNLGHIGSTGGDVALIARDTVVNAGRIDAPHGTAELATGADVLLQDSANSRQVFVRAGSGGTVINAGAIDAAQVSLQAADGNVFALAGKHAAIRANGTTMRDGHVWLVADTGNVVLDGGISATNANGDGGTVDTNAGTLELGTGGDTRVKAAQWNVTTPEFTIERSAARTFKRSLDAGTSINVTTTGGSGASLANGGNGDIEVASNISWRGPASLTLAAYRSIKVDAGSTIKNSGAGNVTLRADATAIDNGGSVTNDGTIDWSHSRGFVRAFYDINGAYHPGTLKRNAAWTSTPDSGIVTQITGYKLVNSADDLKTVGYDLGGNYAAGKDFDATPENTGVFIPIGNIDNPFMGQFDGLGHRIGVPIADAWHDHPPSGEDPYRGIGLFGVIGSSGVVRDIDVGAGTGGFVAPPSAVGILAGINYGTIVDAHSQGSLGMDDFGYAGSVGGLVGLNYGTIARSSSTAYLQTSGLAGGLVGANEQGATIRQSYATGDVMGTWSSPGVGGLAGGNAGLISQSYATGNATWEPHSCYPYMGCGTTSPGGLVSRNDGTITESFATGNEHFDVDPTQVGGIAGQNNGTIGGNVYWNKETSSAPAAVAWGAQPPLSSGLTRAQMTVPASFAGFDFGADGVWKMPAGATHPVLWWETGR